MMGPADDLTTTLGAAPRRAPGALRAFRVVPGGDGEQAPGVSIADFWSFLPGGTYIYTATGDQWPRASVNARLPKVQTRNGPVKPTEHLDEHRPVEQVTWYPGEPQIIRDRYMVQGGWIEHPGATVFNLYAPPRIVPGDPSKAGLWLDHFYALYGSDAEYAIQWFAHRVQFPGIKANCAIALGGGQGIGKDSLLAPICAAVGPWNVSEVSPAQLLGRFNSYVKSVLLRISEARDMGDHDRYELYERSKTLIAAPPDTLRCDEKNLREYAVPNVCGVVFTTNHRTDGLYLPADDRRHYVMWSDVTASDFAPDYWIRFYAWLEDGGMRHVAAYLRDVDLSAFDPKAPPPRTDAWYALVDANRAPEDSDLADVLDSLGHPEATTIDEIAKKAGGTFADWLRDRRNRRQIPHRLESAGYVSVPSASISDRLWVVGRRRQAIYALRSLSPRDRIEAATRLVEVSRP